MMAALKKFQPDFKEIQYQAKEAKRKMLDKVGLKGYNIHTGDVEALVASQSVSIVRSTVAIENLKTVGRLASEIANNLHLPPPVIAGGAVRDAVFGLIRKDDDIFIDLTGVNVDEHDDVCLRFADALRMTSEDMAAYPIGDVLKDLQFGGDGNEYNDADNPTGFIAGYEGFTDYGQFNVLGRTETPEETVDSFDYSLVKCWYDTGTNEFKFHEDFLNQLNNELVDVRDDKTKRRFKRWRERTYRQYYQSPTKMVSRFKSNATYKQEKPKKATIDFESLFTTATTANTAWTGIVWER